MGSPLSMYTDVHSLHMHIRLRCLPLVPILFQVMFLLLAPSTAAVLFNIFRQIIVYIYIYMCICMYIHIYVYVHIAYIYIYITSNSFNRESGHILND